MRLDLCTRSTRIQCRSYRMYISPSHPGFESGLYNWEASALPLCYYLSSKPTVITKFSLFIFHPQWQLPIPDSPEWKCWTCRSMYCRIPPTKSGPLPRDVAVILLILDLGPKFGYSMLNLHTGCISVSLTRIGERRCNRPSIWFIAQNHLMNTGYQWWTYHQLIPSIAWCT